MRFKREHDLSLDEARRRVDMVGAELYKRYSMNSEWDGDHLLVSGRGASGRINVHQEFIEVEVKLGLALLLLEGPIRSAIEEVLGEHFK